MSKPSTGGPAVILVGAGPVGLVAALLLADAGVRTTVIERMLAPGDLPRAISLQDESFRVFEQLGVADALKAQSLLDTGSRYIGLGGKLLAEAKPAPSRIGQPAKTQFDQPVLEQLLFDRAQEHPKIELLLGAEATAVHQDASGVSVDFTINDRTETRDADWLIGADGGRSFVRSALSISLEGTTQPQRWIVVDLLNETRALDPFAEFHCDGVRPYVLVPGRDGRLRIEFMLFDHEDAEVMTSPEQIRALIVPKFRSELDPEDVRRAAVYVAHQRVAREYRSGRCFLVGDAAHLMPPFAGQGLNAGVRDAANLVWKLREAIKGGASEALLDSYQQERRTHGAKMVKVSRRVGAVVMATNPVVTRVRDAVVGLVNLVPPARSYLANMRFITPPDYAAGVAVATPGKHRASPGIAIGRALSQPQVRDADGRVSWLDEYLGAGWALIGIGIDPTLAGGYWTAIDATRLHVLPPESYPAHVAAGGATQLAELSATLTAAVGDDAAFIVVRPDRYVAAVFTQADEPRVVETLRGFVDERTRSIQRTASGLV